MELYRLGKISSGRGAELLGLSRLDFIQHASELGIPYLRVSDSDLDREIEQGRLSDVNNSLARDGCQARLKSSITR